MKTHRRKSWWAPKRWQKSHKKAGEKILKKFKKGLDSKGDAC